MVVGGGYIAVEFSCIFKGYGADVTLMYRGVPPGDSLYILHMI